MLKEKLNYLRWLTRGKVPDKMLEDSFDWKIEGDKFGFKTRANISMKEWKGCYGCLKA